MADSVRKKIFQDWENTLKTLIPTFLQTVVFGTFEPSSLIKPVAGFIPEEDLPERGAKSVSRQELRIVTRIVVEDAANVGYKLEDILAEAEKKVMQDPRRGGFAKDTRYAGTRWLFLDKEYPQAGADLTYIIDFARAIEDPTVQV